MNRLFLFCALVSLVFAVSEARTQKEQKKKMKEELYLVPFNEVSTETLMRIGDALKEQLPLEYKITPSETIPPSAFNSKRRQYFSTALLKLLAKKYSAPQRRVLGVIDYDLFVPELNFVFGEAEVSSQTALISLARLRQEFYGLPPNEKLFMRRALIEAVHELGHTYGLHHCSDPHCVMFFSNSLADTDRKGHHFCPNCLKLLKKVLLKQTD